MQLYLSLLTKHTNRDDILEISKMAEKAWLEPTEGTPQNSVADDITKKVLGSGNHPGRAFREERGFPV